MDHKYDYVIDIEDDSAPSRVVRMVGDGKRVLELGAGPGSISRVLRDTFNCHVTALEIDDEVITHLKTACDRVYRADLNDVTWPENLKDEDEFDVIVVTDVLEHLYDPWRVLGQLRGLLREGGHIVASIPHAGYNGMLASLLDENLEYRENGLLDRGHIRFFGIKNMQALFDDAGLTIEDVEFVRPFPEDTEFADVWGKTPAPMRTSLLKNKFGGVYQVVIKAGGDNAQAAGISLSDLSETGDRWEAVFPKGGLKPSRGARVSKHSDDSVRLLAFFLTQYHPIPENDQWWGKGFTEWTNATKAQPLFEGHYQPHLPADLGFYDLRVSQVRHEQIALAREYGIDGFCYHYYWFSGTRILDAPLDAMLKDPDSDMPFCLCWANENWTRRWDGAEDQILIGQKHLPNDDLDFIESLIPFFKDPRYIRLDGVPFLIVYEPQRLPDPPRSVRIWREYCESIGIGPIHLCAALTNENENYAKFGFDSGVQFPPHNNDCDNLNDTIDFYTPFHGNVVEYETLARSYLERTYEHPNVFRTVSPSWDQTARAGSRAFITLNPTPANYEYWLAESIRRTRQDFEDQEQFVFINAWNEWAEGCHLEPDRHFGREFLEATFRARKNQSRKESFEQVGLPETEKPRTSVSARLEELRQDLSLEIERRADLEKELATERQRLSGVYKELSTKRDRLAEAEEELTRLNEGEVES